MHRRAELERRVEVVERVAEREHGRGVLGRDPVLLGGAGVVAGQAQVLAAAAAGAAAGAQQRLGHAPVQQPPARAAGLLVDELAQLAVGEVVARAELAHEPAADELVERRRSPPRRRGRWPRARRRS